MKGRSDMTINTNRKQKYLDSFQVIEAVDREVKHVMVEFCGAGRMPDYKCVMARYLFYNVADGKKKLIKDNETLLKIQTALEHAYPHAVIVPLRITPQYAPEQTKRYIAVSNGR